MAHTPSRASIFVSDIDTLAIVNAITASEARTGSRIDGLTQRVGQIDSDLNRSMGKIEGVVGTFGERMKALEEKAHGHENGDGLNAAVEKAVAAAEEKSIKALLTKWGPRIGLPLLYIMGGGAGHSFVFGRSGKDATVVHVHRASELTATALADASPTPTPTNSIIRHDPRLVHPQ